MKNDFIICELHYAGENLGPVMWCPVCGKGSDPADRCPHCGAVRIKANATD